jgi:hypothetical protein
MSDTAAPAVDNPATTANDNGGDAPRPESAARAARLPRILRGVRRRYFLMLIANGFLQTAVTVGAALLVRRFFDGVAAALRLTTAACCWTCR